MTNSKSRFNGRGLLLVLWTAGSWVAQAQESRLSRPWENEIARFEELDRSAPPPKHGIVFVGSSSIRLWDLNASFPMLAPLNRGFGGSQLADANYFFDRVVAKHEPRVVVLYAGDNDLALGKSPRAVCDDLKVFLNKVRHALPEARFLFLSIKPSPARWHLSEKQKEANSLCAKLLAGSPSATFVDVGTVLLTEEGVPDPSCFAADKLHLNETGYARWANVLAPYLAGEK